VAIGVYLVLYVHLGSGLPIGVRLPIIAVVALLSIGFAMFDLDQVILDYLNFFRAKKTTSWISPAAKKLMAIKSIRADAVFLSEHRVIGVLKVKPINFGVLSEKDQDSVIYGFLEFLNSLTFQIQIVMRSVNLDLDDYLRHLRRKIAKRDDKIALAYFEHFEEYIRNYIREAKISDRHFYIVIPGEMKGDERNILQNLSQRCDQIKGALSLSGIVSERLDTQQLINFYSSYFTQTFEISDSFISPITIYRKMWKESPQQFHQRVVQTAAAQEQSQNTPHEPPQQRTQVLQQIPIHAIRRPPVIGSGQQPPGGDTQ
jgi:hypothetical protein